MYNSIQLIGYIGQDPEIREHNGKKVASVSLATSVKWKDQGGNKKERTEWHRLALWDGKAKIAEDHLVKGCRIHIQGELIYKTWEKDGVKRRDATIVVNTLTILDFAEKTTATNEKSNNNTNKDDDDLPF